MSNFEIDHLVYVTDRHYRRRTHAAFRRIPRGRISTLHVVHEGDNICCQLEPWPLTAERITKALAEDGEPVAWVFAESRP